MVLALYLGSVDHYKDLVAQYRESQSLQKGACSKSKKGTVAKSCTSFFSVREIWVCIYI